MVDFLLTLQELAFDGAVVEAFEKTSRGFKIISKHLFKRILNTNLSKLLSKKNIKIQWQIFDDEYCQYTPIRNNAYIAPHASKKMVC